MIAAGNASQFSDGASVAIVMSDKMAPEKIGALYREAVERAKNVAVEFIERLRKK